MGQDEEARRGVVARLPLDQSSIVAFALVYHCEFYFAVNGVLVRENNEVFGAMTRQGEDVRSSNVQKVKRIIVPSENDNPPRSGSNFRQSTATETALATVSILNERPT